MKELLLSLIENLVKFPDEVEIYESKGKTTITLEIKVAPKDIGRVIGKKGNIINSLKTLFKTIGNRQNLKCRIEVVDLPKSRKEEF